MTRLTALLFSVSGSAPTLGRAAGLMRVGCGAWRDGTDARRRRRPPRGRIAVRRADDPARGPRRMSRAGPRTPQRAKRDGIRRTLPLRRPTRTPYLADAHGEGHREADPPA